MDMITKSLLDEFSLEQELGGLREDEQFAGGRAEARGRDADRGASAWCDRVP